MSVNKAFILGRLGKDPELKHTTSGQAVCKFSLATSETYKDKAGEKQTKTDWHNIVVWGKLAEICNQYLRKGSEAFVEGKLETQSWEKDGVKHYSTSIIASNVQFIGGKSEKSEDAPKEETKPGSTYAVDDIPF